jgi:hypothetical protein
LWNFGLPGIFDSLETKLKIKRIYIYIYILFGTYILFSFTNVKVNRFFHTYFGR